MSKISRPCHPNYGEALATCLAGTMISSLNLNRFIIEGDSQIVILALQNSSLFQDWRISSLIFDFLDSIPTSSSWEVKKVNKNANFCTAKYIGPQPDLSLTAFPFIPLLVFLFPLLVRKIPLTPFFSFSFRLFFPSVCCLLVSQVSI